MLTTINFSKYKRVFAFGCSFTQYAWPTWADILSVEMPQAKFRNFGLCGAGNLLMAIRMTEANMRYKFTEEDLVMTMWTTICREDRYKHGRWWNTGNIYSAEHDYPAEWVEKYSDTKGYLIRDMAIITQATAYVKALPCDSIFLQAAPFDEQQDPRDRQVAEIFHIYADTVNSLPPTLKMLGLDGEWKFGHSYYNPNHSTDRSDLFGDYHPGPDMYRDYLVKLGMPLTKLSADYVAMARARLNTVKDSDGLAATFTELEESQSMVGIL